MTRSGLERFAEVNTYLFDGSKDIELFGMYGAQNIGDEAMKDVGLATLPEDRTVAVITGSRLPLIGSMIARKVRPHLAVGGGTLIHGGKSKPGQDSWLDVVERFSKADSKVAFFGTGVSFRPEEMASATPEVERWKAILSKAGYIGLRGPQSQAQAAALGVEAQLFGDAAFALHKAGRADGERYPGRIGFNFGECLGDQAHYEGVNAALLKMAAKDYHCCIYVVRPTDWKSTRQIVARSGIAANRYSIVEIAEDVAGYMNSVSRLHAFVGVKLHASGLAMITGVPSLLFEYLPKCRDFMLPIGMEHTLISMDADANAACNKLDAMLSNPQDYCNDSRIGEIAAQQRNTINNYFTKYPPS
jgi:polysaccharide pyruvyl transferase WcaK-like protein